MDNRNRPTGFYNRPPTKQRTLKQNEVKGRGGDVHGSELAARHKENNGTNGNFPFSLEPNAKTLANQYQ